MEPKVHHGLFRAIVKDNKDPQNLRRLKLQIPQTTGAEVTDWAWPIVNTVEPPAIGAGVFAGYFGGDPEYPFWLLEFGKNQSANKRMFVKPLKNSVSLTGLTAYLIVNNQPDKTKEVDLTDTLIAMAQALKNHEQRITALETNLTALHNTLATRTAPNHTHNSAG